MKKINSELLSANIEKRVLNDIAENNICGCSLAVLQSDKIVYKNHFGTVAPDSEVKVSDNTLFRLASMTKPITGIAAMIAVDRGLISLDDPIDKYLSEFSSPYVLDENQNRIPVDEKITVRHILTHTSGIGSGKVWQDSVRFINREIKSCVDSFVSFIAKQPLSFIPGTRAEYSGVASFSVLTSIIQKVTGKDFESFLREEIFIPCGMNSTTFVPSDEQWERLIQMHNKKDGKSEIGETHAGCVFSVFPTTNPLGGAGLLSSLEDYIAFARMLYNRGVTNGKRIVSEKSFELYSSPQVSEAVQQGKQRWGLSVRVITDENYKRLPVGSFGWSGAYGTHFWVDPLNEIIGIYFKNSSYDGGSGAMTSRNFEKDVYSQKGY
jgi:CubicO group peptidase (beta-lactamase class C family)